MKQKRELITKAVVMLVTVAMLVSALPAVLADSDENFARPIFGLAGESQYHSNIGHKTARVTGQVMPYGNSPTFDVGADATITYNDGYTENSLGLTSGGTMTMAIELTDVELAAYRDYDIKELDVSVGADALAPGDIVNYVVWIQNTLPADPYGTVNVVATGTSTDAVWQIIDVTDYPIPDTGSVFIGINFVHTAGQYPCGIDESTTSPARAALLNYVGGSWTDLGTIGFPGVWGLDVKVSEGGGPGPVDECLPDQCDFEIVALNQLYMYDGKINELPKIINITITNNGEIPISELKLLADVYKKICGPTTPLTCTEKYDLRFWETEAAADWDWIDDGDDDTWVLQGGEDNRWYTDNQAWRCTAGDDRSYGGDVDTYLGLADDAVGYDELIWSPANLTKNDISGASCATVTFYHWAEGEYTFDDDGNVIPIDYGTVSYSLDNGATWTELDFSDFVAYDTDGEWDLVTLKILNTNIYDSYQYICDDCEPGEGDIVISEAFPDIANLQLKFTWHKDPCDQYEGWYIDNICLTRTETYYYELVHQTHEILSLPGCEGEPVHTYFEFPLGWDPEPNTWYRIEICGQVFSPAGCEIIIENNCVYTQFYVTDIHDVICKEMTVITVAPYHTDESISVNMTVKNIGTFAESNIPVVLKESTAVVQSKISDTFETDPESRWGFYYFNGFDTNVGFRWSEGDPTISDIWDIDEASARSVMPGNECIVGAMQGVTYPYCNEDTGILMTDDKVYDVSAANSATLEFYAKYSYDLSGGSCMLVHPTEGPDSAYWWITDFGAWATDDYMNDWEFHSVDMKAMAEGFAYDDGGITVVPKIEFGFGVLDIYGPYDGTTANPYNPIPWSGLMLDNIKFDIVSCSNGNVVDSKTIPGTLAPGQEATIMLTWSDATACLHCLTGDVNLPGDVNPDNDICVDTVFVSDYIDLDGFQSLDLTGDGDCLWHLCDTRGGGDDSYAWAGIEEANWAHYVNNMDDSFISPMINISELATAPFMGASLNFTTWYEFADDGDFGEIYIRASSSANWVKLDKLTGSSGGFFTDVGYYIEPQYCTNTFQIRFRMVSDDEGVSEGWYIDDVCIIEIMEDVILAPGDVIFDQPVCPASGDWSFGNCDESLGYGMYENFQITADVPIGQVSIVGLPMYYSGGWVPYPPANAVFHVKFYDGPYTGTTFPPTGLLADFSINTFDSIVAGESYSGYQAYEWTFTLPSNVVVTGQDGWMFIGGLALWGNDVDPTTGDGDAYQVGSGWTGYDAAMTLYEGGLPFVPLYGDSVWCDDFERANIAPWICQSTIAGDYWEHQDGVTKTYLPDTVTAPFDNVDGWWVCHGYPGVGKGLNDILYGKLDLTELGGDAFTYVELRFAMAWHVEAGCEMFIEISPDFTGSNMEDATWIPYWHYPTMGYTAGPSGWITSEDLVDDGRFVLNQYLGKTVYVRFRFTTPGEGAFSPVAGHGWAVDGVGLEFKSFVFTDTEAPVTQIYFNTATSQVTLIAQDYPLNKGTGVKATYYIVDSGAQTTYAAPFTLGEGQHTVKYWSVDNAGNTEAQKSATFVIDTTPPTVSITEPEAGKLYIFGTPLMNRIFSDTTLCIGNKVSVAASASDGTGSGVAMVMFSFSNGDTGYDNVGSDGWTYLFRSMHFGELTITAKSVDGKGLQSSPASMTIKLYSLGLL